MEDILGKPQRQGTIFDVFDKQGKLTAENGKNVVQDTMTLVRDRIAYINRYNTRSEIYKVLDIEIGKGSKVLKIIYQEEGKNKLTITIKGYSILPTIDHNDPSVNHFQVNKLMTSPRIKGRNDQLLTFIKQSITYYHLYI